MADTPLRPAFIDAVSTQVAGLIVKWHLLFFVVGLLIVALGIAGLNRVEASTNSRAFFGAGNEDFQKLLEIEDIYVSSETSLIVISAPEGNAFAAETLEVLRDVTEQAWTLPYTLRVDSLANFNHSRAEGDEIIIEPLLPPSGEITPQIAQQVRDTTLSSGELVNRLVSADGLSYGIVVAHVPPDRDAIRYQGIQAEIEALRTEIFQRLPDHKVFLTGSIAGSLAFASAGQRDLREILPLAGGITVVLLVIGLGAFSGVMGSMLVLAGSGVLTLGMGGWFGMALTPGNSSSPLAVVVLIAATCMHLVLMWRHRIQDGMERRDAVRSSWEENFAPVTVTNLTTAFGFLCLNFSDAPPLRDLGNMIAAGVIGGWFLSLCLLPTFLIWLPKPKRRESQIIPRLLVRVVGDALRHQRLVIIVFSLAAVSAVFGITRIQFNDDFIRYFDESYELRRDSEQIEQRLTPLDVLQFSFKSDHESGVFAPEFLNQIDQFEAWLEAHPQVFQVNSIVPLLKRLNQNLNADRPEFYKLADSAAANAQLMLLYELGLPVGQDLNSKISVDRDQTLVTVSLDINSSVEMRHFTLEAEAWLRENLPEIATKGTGAAITFARISQRNGTSMLIGTVVVLVVISAAMILTLRDVRFGVLSLVPNLMPAILAFGMWGLLLRDVNLGSTVVTVMTFGIVVDDTVHLMMAYKRYRRRGGDPYQAVNLTLANVGTAITFTTLMITAGFSVVAMSSFALNQHLGALTALVVATAFIADLFLLPVLFVKAERMEK